MAKYIGWYWDKSHPDEAKYWNGKEWGGSRPLTQLVGARLYSSATGQAMSAEELPDGYVPTAQPSGAPRPHSEQQGRKAIGGRLGCLLVLAALVVIITVITWVTSLVSVQNNPQFTEENGLSTCKELISKEKNGRGNETVQGSVLAGNLYKATIAYAGVSEVYRWTCRLEWSGGRWNTDILESDRIQ